MGLLSQIVFNIALSSSLYLLIAVAYSIYYNPSKNFDFLLAAIISSAPYLVYFFISQLKLPLLFSIFLSLILITLIAYFFQKTIFQTERRKGQPSVNTIIISLGLYLILQNTISVLFGDELKTISTLGLRHHISILGANGTYIQLITLLTSVLLFIALILLIDKTIFGKSIKAVSSNSQLSNILGIKSEAIILISYLLCSLVCALTGILYALDINLNPTMGFNLLLYGIVVMIIGGIGSYRGLILGAVLVAGAQHVVGYFIDTTWMNAIAFLILILFLVWKPLGFSGNQVRKVEI